MSDKNVQISPAPSDERSNYRTPMQWNANANAGFTSGASTWLPVNGDHAELNVDKQQKAENSHLKVLFQRFLSFIQIVNNFFNNRSTAASPSCATSAPSCSAASTT